MIFNQSNLPKQAVILAAGESSRFWPLNEKHKSLTRILGRPIIWYTLNNLVKAGVKKVVVVQAPEKFVEKELADFPVKGLEISYAIQPKPEGTGDALLCAQDLIKERFLVLNAERIDIFAHAKEMAKVQGDIIIMASKTDRPWLYGILKTQGEKVLEVIEKPIKGQEPSNLMNCGAYIFEPDFISILKQEPKHPFSLIFAINKIAHAKNVSYALVDDTGMFTLKFPWDIFKVRDFLFDSYFEERKESGIKIGEDVKISGKVYIGKNTSIEANTIIEGPCYIGDNCVIGPNNVLRGPLDLESGVETRAGMEIKECIIGPHTHFHSGYVGNSIVAQDCRFGAGFVSANRRFDRKGITLLVKGEKVETNISYLGFICGARTKFGIQSSTMPGVMVGRDCVIGPQASVKENLENNKFLIANNDQIERDKTV